VDTGGIIPEDKDLLASEILRQARKAIEGAACLVLVVDGREGVVPLDEELASLLRRTGRPLALAVNKIDSMAHAPLVADFHRLGIADVFPVSAEHGLGVDDVLDHVTGDIPVAAMSSSPNGWSKTAATEPVEPEPVRVAIIGRPNVGKSTLLNRLLNEERAIVSPIPGTTRDAVDAEFERDGLRFRLVDTAGIRRKGKTKLLAEKLSVIQARKHLERADVALLVLDAIEGVTALDANIGGYAHESGRSIVLVVNKWDAVRRGPDSTLQQTEIIRRRMKYLDYAPIVFISALKGQRLNKLLATVARVAEARRRRISTAEMNRFLQQVNFDRATTPAHRPGRIYFLTQAGVAPPTFIAFTHRRGSLHFSLERFLENRIREHFDFTGTPLVIKSRQTK
jgi:GTP-binding protein